MLKKALFLSMAVILLAMPLLAGIPIHITAIPEELEWKPAPPALPPGAHIVILEGDPGKKGFFAMRIKFPPGYKIMPHSHPVQERVTVLEGAFQLGAGDNFSEPELKTYPAGSYLSMPAGMRHFATSRDGCVIQLTTVGPWGITYVNPADDPRNQSSRVVK